MHQIADGLLGRRFLQIAGTKHAHDSLAIADWKVVNPVLARGVQRQRHGIEDVERYQWLSHQAR
jgi:hypothetical protein